MCYLFPGVRMLFIHLLNMPRRMLQQFLKFSLITYQTFLSMHRMQRKTQVYEVNISIPRQSHPFFITLFTSPHAWNMLFPHEIVLFIYYIYFISALLLAYLNGNGRLCRELLKNGSSLGAINKNGVSIFNAEVASKKLLFSLLGTFITRY